MTSGLRFVALMVVLASVAGASSKLMEPTISTATVLLPMTTTKVAFRVTASPGCFEW